MAVGAYADLDVRVRRLADGDRDLVRLVLNDLVRTVLAESAARVNAEVALDRGWLRVTVAGDRTLARPPAPRLAPLRARLAEVGGSVADGSEAADAAAGPLGSDGHRLLARWPASSGTA
jgi:hypothetical protein